jgi:hypothetical protein
MDDSADSESNERTAAQADELNGAHGRTRTLRSEQIGVVEAMRWHWGIVLFCVVLLTGAGVALALVRTPVYTSTATLNVDFAAQSPTTLSGSLSAAQASAEAYARAFDSTALINRVAKETKLAPETVLDRVSTSAIPENTVITVDAEGDSAGDAKELANVSANALIAYVTDFAGAGGKNSDGDSADLLESYRKASAQYNKYFAEQERLGREINVNPTSANIKAFQEAKLKTQVAQLKREGLFQTYTESQRSYVAPVGFLAKATDASDDRLAKLQLLGFVGLAAGLAVGAALATLRANRTSAIA